MLKIDSHSKTNTHLRRGLTAYVRDVLVRFRHYAFHIILQCIQPIHHNLSMGLEVSAAWCDKVIGTPEFRHWQSKSLHSSVVVPPVHVSLLQCGASLRFDIVLLVIDACADYLCHRAPSVSQHTCTLRLSRMPLSGVMPLSLVASHWSRVTLGDGSFQC